MERKRNQRRQIVVDANLQVGLSLRLIGWLYVYVVLFAVAVNVPAIYAVAFGDAASTSYSESVEQLRGFTSFTAVPLILTFVVMALHGVAFTHRIAGPVYRFKQTLRAMAAGQAPASIKLRSKDYMKDLADEFNQTLAAQREEATRLRRMNNEALDGARRLVEAAERPGADPTELAALAHAVLDSVERLDLHMAHAPTEGGRPIPMPEAEVTELEPAAVPA